MRLYSFKCLCSSFGSLGGNQLGRVLDKTFSFSLLIGNGSIMTFDRCKGGSEMIGVDERLGSSKRKLDVVEPLSFR